MNLNDAVLKHLKLFEVKIGFNFYFTSWLILKAFNCNSICGFQVRCSRIMSPKNLIDVTFSVVKFFMLTLSLDGEGYFWRC